MKLREDNLQKLRYCTDMFNIHKIYTNIIRILLSDVINKLLGYPFHVNVNLNLK